MAITGSALIKERLDQQAKDYGIQIGRTLNVEQYLGLLQQGGGITQHTYDTLWKQYQDAVTTEKGQTAAPIITVTDPKAIPPSPEATASLIKTRLEEQARSYGSQIGRTLTVEQYLTVLQSGGGITESTVKTLLDKYQQATKAEKPPVTPSPVVTTPRETTPTPTVKYPVLETHPTKEHCPGTFLPAPGTGPAGKVIVTGLDVGEMAFAVEQKSGDISTVPVGSYLGLDKGRTGYKFYKTEEDARRASAAVKAYLFTGDLELKTAIEKGQVSPEAAEQWAGEPLTATKYEFTLPNGKSHSFEAFSRDEALAIVAVWGASPGNLQEVGVRTLSPYEMRQMRESLGAAMNKGVDAYTKAMKQYGLIPDDAVAIGDRAADVVFMLPETIDRIKSTAQYQDERGTEAQRVIATYHWLGGQDKITLPDGSVMYQDSIKDRGGNVIITGFRDLPRRFQEIAQEKGYGAMMNLLRVEQEGYKELSEKLEPYVTDKGIDSKAAYDAGIDKGSITQYIWLTLSDDSRDKLDSGEWTLLPYGDIIETKALNEQPPTIRNMMETDGIPGYEAHQQQWADHNVSQHWLRQTADVVYGKFAELGFDIRNYTLLESTLLFPEIKTGTWKDWLFGSGPLLTAYASAVLDDKQAAQLSDHNATMRKMVLDTFDASEMAAQEWIAARPELHPVYAEGFLDSVNKDPWLLTKPLIWTETMASTIPYTVSTGIIMAGGALGGPGGVAAVAPLAFYLTLSVEGLGIYRDAIKNGADHEQALFLANAYGSISAAIETVGDTFFVGRIGAAYKAVSSSLGHNVAGNVIRGAAKQYGWKKLSSDALINFINQGTQEVLQEVVHNAAIKTVNENQSLLENTANAFVSGIIGTAPFVLIPAGGTAVKLATSRITDAKVTTGPGMDIGDITPSQQVALLNKILEPFTGATVKETNAALSELKKLEGGPSKLDPTRRVYGLGKKAVKGFIDEKSIRKAKDAVSQTLIAYNAMVGKVQEYAFKLLELKQVQKAISDFGLAKSGEIIITDKDTGKRYTLKAFLKRHPSMADIYEKQGHEAFMRQIKKAKNLTVSTEGQLGLLEKLTEQEKKLSKEVDGLKDTMEDATNKYADLFLDNAVGLEMQQRQEIREAGKTIAMDMDAVTTQLFGERDALEIAKDIKQLAQQIGLIEAEIKKGMTVAQAQEYGKTTEKLQGEIDALQAELRQRFWATGEEVVVKGDNLHMLVTSLHKRLIGARAENWTRGTDTATVSDLMEAIAERNVVEAIEKTTEAVYGRESYASVLSRLNGIVDNLLSLMTEAKLPTEKATKAAFAMYDAIKKQDYKQLKAAAQMLQLEAGKIKDKPLQLAAGQQVKLLETVTAENIWKRYQQKAKPVVANEIVWYKAAEVETQQNEQLRREAERIVEERYAKLAERLPEYIRRQTQQDIMDYLRRMYNREYFEDAHEGLYRDLDEYLDVDKEMARLYQEVARQEELTNRRADIEIHEREKDLADNWRDKVEGTERKAALEQRSGELQRQIEKKKVALKQAEATPVAMPMQKVIDVTETQAERGVELAKAPEVALEIADKEAEARAQEKAARSVRIAKEELARERTSAFPGIEPKPKEARRVDSDSAYAQAMAQYLTRMTPDQAMKILSEEMPMDVTGIHPFTADQVRHATWVGVSTHLQQMTQTATQVQIQQAVQTAVKQALQTEVKTATKQQLKLATQTVVKTVTKTVTKMVQLRILVPPPPLPIIEVEGQKYTKIPDGSIAWKQGIFWRYLEPPWTQEKPGISKYPPKGALRIGEKTPRETIQMIGSPKAKVPKEASIDLGVVDIQIKDYGRRIEFTGGGLKTVAGKSLASPTAGMSIPGGGVMPVAAPVGARRRPARTPVKRRPVRRRRELTIPEARAL